LNLKGISTVDIDTFVGDMPPPPSDADADMAEAVEGERHPQM